MIDNFDKLDKIKIWFWTNKLPIDLVDTLAKLNQTKYIASLYFTSVLYQVRNIITSKITSNAKYHRHGSTILIQKREIAG